jgi:broad specificity phosphatase PhoE
VKTAEKTLVLVKHSLPDTNPKISASEWQLSDEGRRRCSPLALRLKTYLPASICSSEESKARETALLLAENLKTNFKTLPDLEEHHRENEPCVGRQR